MSNIPGKFIVLEGIDGTGKTTLTKDLSSIFSLETTRMPGGSDFAEKVRGECRNADISRHTQVLFYAALISDCNESGVRPAVMAGKNILSDRSFGSTFAYQALSADREDLLLAILSASPHLLVPDLTIYLDIDLDISEQREGMQDRVDVSDRYSRMARIERETIKEAYDKLYIRQAKTAHIAEFNERMVWIWKLRERLTKRIAVIDARQSYDRVLADCQSAISEHLGIYATVQTDAAICA